MSDKPGLSTTNEIRRLLHLAKRLKDPNDPESFELNHTAKRSTLYSALCLTEYIEDHQERNLQLMEIWGVVNHLQGFSDLVQVIHSRLDASMNLKLNCERCQAAIERNKKPYLAPVVDLPSSRTLPYVEDENPPCEGNQPCA